MTETREEARVEYLVSSLPEVRHDSSDLPLKERELEAWRASEGIKTANERVPATLYYAPSAEADLLASEADRARSLGTEVLYSYEGYPALLVAAPEEALEALVMHSNVEAVVFSRAGEFTGDFKNYSYRLVENAVTCPRFLYQGL